MRSNRRLRVREIAEECNISIESCYDILTTKLEMHKVVSKFVPRLLTQDQRHSRVDICQELLDRASEDENENAVFTIGWKKLAETEKCAAGQVERESHVDGFSFLTLRVLCIMNSYVRGKQ
jgi:predicted DNA-binding protein YlxM (UPF0122 family)